MPLIGASAFMGYLRTYRTCHITGRYGGGKTSLAYRLAYELINKHGYRYLVSNIGGSSAVDRSVWHDKFEDVVLREGQYADTVVILDEAGIFLKTGMDAEDFLAFLRKLNIILLMPSYDEPATKLRKLTVQRMLNFQSFGLPMWMYSISLKSGRIKENQNFFWWQPTEIYGVYDTNAFVDGDGGLGEFIESVTYQAAANQGYTLRRGRKAGAGALVLPSGAGYDGYAGMEGGGRIAASVLEAAEAMEGVVSVLESSNNKRRRR